MPSLNGKVQWLLAAAMFGSGSVGGFALNEKINSNRDWIANEQHNRERFENRVEKKIDQLDDKIDRLLKKNGIK